VKSFRIVILAAFIAGMVGLSAHAESPASPSAEAAVPLEEPPAFEPPDPETVVARTREVAKGLRCPVCQGLSVADSNADSARAMHDRIEELVAQGYSEEQISDYFVDRYGAWVRLEPEAEGMALVIFVMPAALLVFGGLWLAARGRSPEANAESPTADPTDYEEDEYRKRILAELGER